VAKRLIENAYLWQHFKQRIKAAIRRSGQG
jgi:hypothetical protein